jgi:hypothetical protein
MARTWHADNPKILVFSESQKGFINKTNDCSEHGTILNELLHDANRRKQALIMIVTAIDFTNAVGCVTHELII